MVTLLLAIYFPADSYCSHILQAPSGSLIPVRYFYTHTHLIVTCIRQKFKVRVRVRERISYFLKVLFIFLKRYIYIESISIVYFNIECIFSTDVYLDFI